MYYLYIYSHAAEVSEWIATATASATRSREPSESTGPTRLETEAAWEAARETSGETASTAATSPTSASTASTATRHAAAEDVFHAAAGTATAEEHLEDLGGVDAAHAAHTAHVAEVHAASGVGGVVRAHVELPAGVGVGEDRVGLVDVLEHLVGLLLLLLAALVPVGVPLGRELPIGLLDVVVTGVLADPEYLVVVLLGGLLGLNFRMLDLLFNVEFFRFQLVRLLVISQRLLLVPQRLVDVPPLHVGLRVLGVELHGLVEHLERLLVLALLAETKGDV